MTLRDGRVVEGRPAQATAAFDLTFSAPKSVSTLWALVNHREAEARIRAAHEAAVRSAFDYLERTACVTRRGAGGARQIRGEGFVAAMFHHRLSRAGDPQLHTHVLVANATKAEGRYTALHGALLYREAKTAGYLYHAVLRAEMTKRLGVEWHRDPTSPHPEIVGVDRRLRDLFSKRSEEIAAQLEATGQSSARAANAAALDTRAAKAYFDDPYGDWSIADVWHAEAREIDAPDVREAIGHIPARAPVILDTSDTIRSIKAHELGPNGLTKHRTTFHRRDLIQVACDRTLTGAPITQIERLADAIIDQCRREIVPLHGDTTTTPEGDAVRGDGLPLRDGRADIAFTTRELLEAELSVIQTAQQRANDHIANASPYHVHEALRERERLSAEQRRMVTNLTMSGAGTEFVVGLAGAGKTTSLEAAHDAWRRSDIEVRGTATALNAAKNLEAETGIPSETIAMLRTWHEQAEQTGDRSRIDDAVPRGGVLIVDEAGMTETRDLAFLTKLAREQDAKFVFVGDHRQLPEIGAGGTFEHLVHRFEPEGRTSRLTHNRRQHEAWERDALGELREGSVERAIATYEAEGRIVTDPSPERLREQLAADWIAARERGRAAAMLAYTNAEVESLNATARRLLNERGTLGPERATWAGREWAAGDALIATHNNRALGLTNGTRGIVTRVDERGLELRTHDGRDLRVPRDYLERGHAAHAYATTGHKTQGLTINGEAFVLASDHLSREWLYVAMSRATDASRIYIDTLDHDPATGRALTPREQHDAALIDLADMARRSGRHTLAHDHGTPITDPTQRLDRNDLRRAMNRDAALRERLDDPVARHQYRERATPRRDIGMTRDLGGRGGFGIGR
jgi:conjugative relaxase-like TrwC/TraI family protein